MSESRHSSRRQLHDPLSKVRTEASVDTAGILQKETVMIPKHNHSVERLMPDDCPACQHYMNVALLGKRVRVVMDYHDDKAVAEGKLLGFGDGGDFELLEDDGFIHYCWPLLKIEEIKE